MESLDMRMRVANVARSWIGTPFYPHCAIKGVGADCVQCVLGIYKEAGLIPIDTTLPRYYVGNGEHLQDSIVQNWIATCAQFSPEEVASAGSLITLRIGRVSHHVAVMETDRHFIHCIRWRGVVRSDLSDATFASRLASIWRPVIKG